MRLERVTQRAHCQGRWILIAAMALLWSMGAQATKSSLFADLELVTADAKLSAGVPAEATLAITPDIDLAEARVTFVVEHGDAVITGPAEVALGALSAGKPYIATTSIALSGKGKVSVRGTLTAIRTDLSQWVRQSKSLYIVSSGGYAKSGSVGHISLQVDILEQRKKAGNLTKSRYEEELRQVLYGGAASKVSLGYTKLIDDITVTGTILWTDQDGNTHPARMVTLEVHDASDGSDDPLISMFANTTGWYYANVTGTESGRDIFVRVKAKSPFMSVNETLNGSAQAMDSSTTSGVAGGTVLTIELTANNTDDNNQAFSVHDAMYMIVNYGDSLATLERIQTVFPGPKTSYSHDLKRIQMVKDDWPDWDVAHHEYAHYYQRAQEFNNSPGRRHGVWDNLGETEGRDKSEGIRLAWPEGHATYFGTVGQISQTQWDDSLKTVKGVGDTAYIDFLDGGGYTYDLEVNTNKRRATGEDNEMAVQRILFDLYDSASDEHDEVRLGDWWLNSIIVSNKVTTLSAFWNALKTVKTVQQDIAYGGIFMDHHVSPEPTAPDDGDQFFPFDSPPQFTWEPRGAGAANRLDKFTVEFYNHDFSELLHASAEQSETEYRPSQDDWENKILAGGHIVKWVVKGRSSSAPETGVYVSADRSIGGVDVAFVIDDTGSMGEEIEGIRNALTNFISAVADELFPPTISLITFKDSVTSRIVSGDLDAVQAVVDTLSANGGDDCPEGSIEALNLGGRHVVPGGRILFATDADAHENSDIPATIAALRAKGIRVDVLLTASCDGSFKSATGCNLGICDPEPEPVKTVGDCTDPDCFDPIPQREEIPNDAILAFSAVAAETGGLFAFVPEVNDFDTTRFDNVALNVMLGAVFSTVTDSNPHIVTQGTTVDVLITGSNTNFSSLSTVTIDGGGITVNSTQAQSATSLLANITVDSEATLSFRDITVTTTFGKQSTEAAAGTGVLEVEAALGFAAITSVYPTQGGQGETLNVTIRGANTNFNETSVADFGFGITVNEFTPLGLTEGVANITIDEETGSLGFHDVSVNTTTPSEFASESVPGPFLVSSQALVAGVPRIRSITPPAGAPGTTTLLALTGENTSFEDGITEISVSGSGVTVDSVTVSSATELTATITIDSAAALGFRDVTVTTGEEVASSLNGFQVGNTLPVADAGEDQEITTTGTSETVTLDGSGSYDSDGSIASYTWTGTPDPDDEIGPTVDLAPGEYTFTLVVEDDQGIMSNPDEVTITINGAPVADAGPDQTVTTGEDGTATVTLDGSASTDPLKTIAVYTWTGTPDPEDVASPTLTLTAGSYEFTLVVTDQRGASSDPDTVIITVSEPTPAGCSIASNAPARKGLLGDGAMLLAVAGLLILNALRHPGRKPGQRVQEAKRR